MADRYPQTFRPRWRSLALALQCLAVDVLVVAALVVGETTTSRDARRYVTLSILAPVVFVGPWWFLRERLELYVKELRVIEAFRIRSVSRAAIIGVRRGRWRWPRPEPSALVLESGARVPVRGLARGLWGRRGSRASVSRVADWLGVPVLD